MFDRHHDSFICAPHVVDGPAECDRVMPFATLAPALARGTLPPFVWITPDVDHDMHAGTVAESDASHHARTCHGARTSTPMDDGGVLRTIETMYHLPHLDAAPNPRSGTLLPLLGIPRARD